MCGSVFHVTPLKPGSTWEINQNLSRARNAKQSLFILLVPEPLKKQLIHRAEQERKPKNVSSAVTRKKRSIRFRNSDVVNPAIRTPLRLHHSVAAHPVVAGVGVAQAVAARAANGSPIILTTIGLDFHLHLFIHLFQKSVR